jgi:Endonuclease/Exonuclease/phosphatase family
VAQGRPALRFAWWNTGLAPARVRPEPASHRAAASGVVGRLIQDQGCGLIALAEVRGEQPLEWVPLGVHPTWAAIVPGEMEKDFDLAILYDTKQLRAVDHVWEEEPHAGGRVRVGLVVTFEGMLADAPNRLVVATAHWRSDLGDTQDAEARRTRAAEALRRRIGTIARSGEPVLVMGDLNAEPFAPQLTGSLPTARSRDVVHQHQPREPEDLLLYNPSWRWLGERAPWTGDERPSTLAGTYRTSGNRPSAWRTFDQVLVSAELLGPSGWSLREDELGVWPHEDVFDAAKSRPRSPFDHLPIVGLLEWR